MEASHLRYFYEVAKEGSFTYAARKLRISQPTLSKAVAILEAEAKGKFLERSKRGVRLTELGTEVYAKCQDIFEALTEVHKICDNTIRNCGGKFRFGVSDHIGNYLMAPKLAQMTELYPDLLPTLFVGTPQDLIKDILQRDIEFALMFTRIPSPEIEYQSLMKVPLAVVCHPKLLSKKQRSSTKPLNYIGSIRKDFERYPAQEIINSLKVPVSVRYEANTQEMQKRLCVEGLGVAILARFMVENELKSKSLVEIKSSEATPMDLLVAKRKGAVLTANAKHFLQSIRE